MNKFLLLVKESRPIGWIFGPAVFLIGMTFSGSITITTLSILQILMLSFPFCIAGYGINDIYDYESDKLNPRKNVLGGWLSPTLEPQYHPYIKNVSFIVISLLLLTSFLTLNITNILGMVLLGFFGYFYSAPPLRFKEKPPLDSFVNGIIYFFAPFLLGFSFGGSIFDVGIDVYLITACVMGIHAYTTIMDYDADKKTGHKTFATVFSERGASLFAFLTFIFTLFIAKLSTLINPSPLNPFSAHHYWSYNYYYLAFGSLLFFITSVFPSRNRATLFSFLLVIAFVLMIISYFFVDLF